MSMICGLVENISNQCLSVGWLVVYFAGNIASSLLEAFLPALAGNGFSNRIYESS
jgi:hypothetical protein